MAFLYTNNKLTEREIRKAVPFIIAPKILRYLAINLTKETKNLYSENFRMLKKDTEEDMNKRKNISCSWTGRINIINRSILPNATYKFNPILIKIPTAYFKDLKQILQKFFVNKIRPQIVTAILRKNNNVGGLTIPDIKLYYKATILKTAWYWHKYRHIDQGNRTENPEIDPSQYAQLIFDKGDKSIQ
uniref:Uncharacterized protein n=1 Tax=Pipistrellus kuhlii TaxID=59472 RepID=A0A7J8B2R4_PIPKU|nr:hypothetical protein mPipKuh1_007836 [Pipistrellus kuhlii]